MPVGQIGRDQRAVLHGFEVGRHKKPTHITGPDRRKGHKLAGIAVTDLIASGKTRIGNLVKRPDQRSHVAQGRPFQPAFAVTPRRVAPEIANGQVGTRQQNFLQLQIAVNSDFKCIDLVVVDAPERLVDGGALAEQAIGKGLLRTGKHGLFDRLVGFAHERLQTGKQ